MISSDIRQAFLAYFAEKGHQVVPSSALIPANDPTLLFTNAGMVQFKDTFLGTEPRSYLRATTSQRCLRAGGKHNDLDNVGYTARHHTLFEMLGNFSFGDYFKREAIFYAWEFLTRVLHLPPEKLWVTVYKDDDEAADIWLKEVGVSADRFSRCGEKDNFWSMGDTGPCGPCTEIFYDHGPEIPGGPPGSPEEDGDRYIEIWNLVFMQYNRDAQGELHPLPKPSVDTGMGLERIAAVVQGVHNNYEIDIFQHLIGAIIQLKPGLDPKHTSLKVIADHIRACAFLIADGILPGNEGRGYVLRRIIRRAVRHGNKLKLPGPFFSKLVPALIEVMGETYPELEHQAAHIAAVLDQEEIQFNRTLEQGLSLLQDHLHQLESDIIPGEIAFKLYDTYGFPVDLTEDIARELGKQVDLAGFNQCMDQQRALSQAASQFAADYHTLAQVDAVTEFKGYECEELEAKVEVILAEGKKVDALTAGSKAIVILDKTAFYAESGGQVGDKGLLLGKGLRFAVEDSQKSGTAILHYGMLLEGRLEPGQTLTARVDSQRRDAIRLNHTATHLLHAALKQVVGPHVQQKGSLVDAERARFDFSHQSALDSAQLQQLEKLVNDKIRENLLVDTALMSLDEAKASGAVALFGEKYADSVRVLTMGDFSKELCGGTHARRTGDIGLFKIVAEYGVASGVRRIEMLTGAYALDWVNSIQEDLNNLALLMKTNVAHLAEKAQQLLQDNRRLEKDLQKLQQQQAVQSGADLVSEAVDVDGFKLLVKRLDHLDAQGLRTMVDQLKSRLDRAVIVLYAVQDNKISVIAALTKSIVGQVPPAAAWVRHLCGKGGGRDDMAQGGADLPSDLKERLDSIQGLLKAG